MKPEIKHRIEQIKNGQVPEGYKKTKIGIVPKDWEESQLSKYLAVNTERNDKELYNKDDVFSISGEKGIVNQIDLLGRSYAGASVAPYRVVYPNDIVYTKSPLKANPYGIIKTNLTGKCGIVSTLYAVFKCKENVCPRYVQAYFELDEKINNYLYPIVNIGAKHDMKISDENSLKGWVVFPALEEQEKIVQILSTQDKIIELKTRVVGELKKQKKYYLSKMFPQKGKNVPEIRFKGFTDTWEQRKLGEIFVSLQNNTLSRAELSNIGVAKNIHYGDILVKFSECLDVKRETLPLISDEGIISKYKMSYLQNGDVIVSDTAEDEAVGKCTEIEGISTEIVLSGLHTIPYRPIIKFANGYLGYFMNSNAYHNQLLPLMQGIKVTSISKSAMQDTHILYPRSTTEQRQIGEFFKKLDNLIALHQRELEQEKQKKKALMQLLLKGIVRV